MNHRKILPFYSLWPGQYFRSYYTKSVFVKRNDWYAEPILLSGLADESNYLEFGENTEVELLDCESQWPEIDYRPRILAWNWDYIAESVQKNIYWGDENQPYGVCWVGSQLGIIPSGKIYAFWTSNQTPEDVNRDRQFNDALEAILSEKGYWADWESGDLRICKSMTCEEVARAAGYELQQGDKGTYWVEIKDPDNFGDVMEDEEEAWYNCCLINQLVG